MSASVRVTVQAEDGRPPVVPPDPPGKCRISWSGEISSQKWTNFYMKVLSKLAAGSGLKLTVTVEAAVDGAAAGHKVQEMKAALRELGLDDMVDSA